MDRSTFYKVLNGKRKITNLKQVEKLCSYLSLSPAQAEALFEAFEISSMGEEAYLRRQAVIDFIEKFENTRSVSSRRFVTSIVKEEEDKPFEILEGRNSLESALVDVLSDEAGQTKPVVKLIMQPDSGSLTSLIRSIFTLNPESSIQHIYALDSPAINKNNKTLINNLKTVQNILPFYSGGGSYEGFAIYGTQGDLHDYLISYPALLITQAATVMFQPETMRGIVIRGKEEAVYFSVLFDDTLKHADRKIERISDYVDFIRNLETHSNTRQAIYNFQMLPCLTYFLDEPLVEKYLNPLLPNRAVFKTLFLQYIEVQKQQRAEGIWCWFGKHRNMITHSLYLFSVCI